MSDLPDWLSEKQIEVLILNYLKAKGIFCWKIDQVGYYSPSHKAYLKPSNPHRIKGVSDICGIYKGLPLFIEVKKADGRLSPEQKIFIQKAKDEGAIAFVARSIDDVRLNLGIA